MDHQRGIVCCLKPFSTGIINIGKQGGGAGNFAVQQAIEAVNKIGSAYFSPGSVLEAGIVMKKTVERR